MKLEVENQHIAVTEREPLTSGAVNVYTAEFSFDSVWDGYTPVAVFESSGAQGKVSREAAITDGKCTVPWEVLLPGNSLRIGVYGISGDRRLPTIYADSQFVDRGAEPAEEAAEPTPGVIEQFVAQTAEDRAAAEAAADRAEEAATRQPYPNEKTGTWWIWDAEAGTYRDSGEPYGGSSGGAQETDPTVPAWAKAEQKPGYTASEVGADPSGTAAAQVAAHNTGETAHNDIRLLIHGLTDRLNALADSDDTTLDQLSEVVAYIKSNRDLLSAITSDKVSVSDIINDLVTNVADKPLSAAQGVALKALIDAIEIPNDDHINSLINTALGTVENGSY